MKAKIKKITIDIFCFEVWIYIWEKEWFVKFRSKKFNTKNNMDWLDWRWALTYMLNERKQCLWVDIHETKKEQTEIMTHEINHSIQRMLEYMGISMWIENTELVSNLREYMLPKALELIKK